MKIVLQRVKEARVEVEGRTVGRSGRGLCLLVGIEKGDSEGDAEHPGPEGRRTPDFS